MSKEEFGPDFRFLVRLANTDLDGKQNVVNALAGIKGINTRLARVLADHAALPKTERIGNLSDAQIDTIATALEDVAAFTPVWMRNRRMDPATGDDEHHVGSEIDLVLEEDINTLKKIRSWKGHRHDKNLPVRGQRTKANGRTGATVGVQRKK
jgi:small subunit ribosomal protein S13